jgi:hypothetical protein
MQESNELAVRWRNSLEEMAAMTKALDILESLQKCVGGCRCSPRSIVYIWLYTKKSSSISKNIEGHLKVGMSLIQR